MNRGLAILALAVAVVGVFGIAALVALFGAQGQNGTSSSAPPVVTLQDLIAGKYPTASDKHGTGGVTVQVKGLYVLYTENENDGDWHVVVTDGKANVFITEIIPRDQAQVGRPPERATIDETGVVYCDAVHETEAWHGKTCWEIHPVTAWSLSASNLTRTSRTTVQGLGVDIAYGKNPVPRGSNQTIWVSATDVYGPVVGATVSVVVEYASGTTMKSFSCLTADSGSCTVEWTIGSASAPGTFSVVVSVAGSTVNSSFQVTA